MPQTHCLKRWLGILNIFTHAEWEGNQPIRTCRLEYFSDNEDLMRGSAKSPSNFENFASEIVKTSTIESVHTSYLKPTLNATLNVSKYPNNIGVYGELRRFLVLHNAWSLAMKHWLRLSEGTANALLNKSYHMACSENHPWIQSVH